VESSPNLGSRQTLAIEGEVLPDIDRGTSTVLDVWVVFLEVADYQGGGVTQKCFSGGGFKLYISEMDNQCRIMFCDGSPKL
jgi:hypothetical protein